MIYRGVQKLMSSIELMKGCRYFCISPDEVLLNSQHLNNMTTKLRARLWLVGSLSDAPRNTSAVGSPCLPAGEGGCLNLTCSSHANPAVSEVTWYRIHGEHIIDIGTGSSLSIQLWNANNVFFCEARNDIGTEKSNVYKIDIQSKLIQNRINPELVPKGFLDLRQKTKQCVDQSFEVRLTQNQVQPWVCWCSDNNVFC